MGNLSYVSIDGVMSCIRTDNWKPWGCLMGVIRSIVFLCDDNVSIFFMLILFLCSFFNRCKGFFLSKDIIMSIGLIKRYFRVNSLCLYLSDGLLLVLQRQSES